MITQLTTKGIALTKQATNGLKKHLEKIGQYLPAIPEDFIVFRLILKKETDHFYPKTFHSHPKSYTKSKSTLSLITGSATFRFKKKQFFVHFSGRSPEECIDTAFRLITKELEKFKDLHFSSESKYQNHTSLRYVPG